MGYLNFLKDTWITWLIVLLIAYLSSVFSILSASNRHTIKEVCIFVFIIQLSIVIVGILLLVLIDNFINN